MGMVLFVGAIFGLLLALAIGFAIFSSFGSSKLGIGGTSITGIAAFLFGLATSLYQFYGACALGGLGIVGYGLIGSVVLLIVALFVNGIDDLMSGRTFNPFGK